ncbi:MAG: hypothetical protein AAB267_10155 [Candidatus Desantisbacteria bacterium]
MAKKTVSDLLSKQRCKKWLESTGFDDVKSAKNESCDLRAKKDGKDYYIEIKYSSKEKGEDFFGTVMLTEMHKAIENKSNYLFLICRGNDKIDNWFFKLFTVEDFLKYCTLTTPIFHYRIHQTESQELSVPNFGKKSTLASEELINEMWQDFKKWKTGCKL